VNVPGENRRIRRLFGFGVWCFIVVGSAHLLIMALSTVRGASAERRHAQDAMRAVPITMLGLTRNLEQLFTGTGVTMGLLAVGIGVLSLVAVRQAPELLTGRRAVIWVDLVAALVLLPVSILAFPPPPIIALTAAAVAFGLALATPSEAVDTVPAKAAPVSPEEVRHVAD
jgi:hypothetical protein